MATTNAPSPQLRQMSSAFMARRKVYEQDDTQLFYTTVAQLPLARPGSPQVSNATPKPSPRKSQVVPDVPDALPRVKSDESLRRRVPRNSLDMRPNVPKRSSSIRSNRNHRSKDLHSLHLQTHQIFSSLDGAADVQDEHPLFMESASPLSQDGCRHSCSIDRSSSQISRAALTSQASIIREDSPLGHTLTRKQSSLPAVEVKADPRLSLLDSRLTERDSCISHRDRESFLASFPQPPKAPQKNRVYAHRRNSSSQNYSLFPRSPPASETNFDRNGIRQSPRQSQEKPASPEPLSALPQVKDEVEVSRPSTARPGITGTTNSCWAVAYDHPELSFSNPDFSASNLQLDLDPHPTGTVHNTSSSSRSAMGQYTQLEVPQTLRKRNVNKPAHRWGFGGFAGDHRLSFYHRHDGHGEKLIDQQAEKETPANGVWQAKVDESCRFDEKHGPLRTVGSEGGLRKKSGSYFGLKEQASSASMSQLLVKGGGPSKPKKSLLKRIICW